MLPMGLTVRPAKMRPREAPRGDARMAGRAVGDRGGGAGDRPGMGHRVAFRPAADRGRLAPGVRRRRFVSRRADGPRPAQARGALVVVMDVRAARVWDGGGVRGDGPRRRTRRRADVAVVVPGRAQLGVGWTGDRGPGEGRDRATRDLTQLSTTSASGGVWRLGKGIAALSALAPLYRALLGVYPVIGPLSGGCGDVLPSRSERERAPACRRPFVRPFISACDRPLRPRPVPPLRASRPR